MTYNFWLEGKIIDVEKLSACGFTRVDGEYFRKIDLSNGIYVAIKVKSASVQSKDAENAVESSSDGKRALGCSQIPQLYVDVFDGIVNKKCAQFYNGHSGAALKAEVRQKVVAALPLGEAAAQQ